MQVIIYLEDNGTLAIIRPFLGCGLTIEQIALKDVPTGKSFKIIDASELPEDRTWRDFWTVPESALTDGVGADYGVGSTNLVVGYAEDGSPMIATEETGA